MSAQVLLSLLKSVRQAAPGRWLARCPAHDDKSPSLSIREADDGRVLVHCFAGCGASDVVSAVGLTLSDLFAVKLAEHVPGSRPNHWHATREALKTLHAESLIVAIGAEDCSSGESISEPDKARLHEAALRIRGAVEAVL